MLNIFSVAMRVDATVVAELRGVLELDDIDQMKNRISSLVSALEESGVTHSGSTMSVTSGSDVILPSELARELHDALEESNTTKLSQLIKENKSVASVVLDSTTGVTVLHRAVELGNSHVVNMLMDQIDSESQSAKFLHNLNGELLVSDLKSRLNARTKLTGYSPLHFAVSSGSDKVVAELLRRGADPDQRSTDEQGVTPFLLACELGQEMAVRMMIKTSQGRCVDSTDSEGNTALHLAAENGHVGIVEVLMSVMPQLEREENKDGKTPAHLARPEIARMILEMSRANANQDQDNGGGFFFG
jgi:ankyrin repeat protein